MKIIHNIIPFILCISCGDHEKTQVTTDQTHYSTQQREKSLSLPHTKGFKSTKSTLAGNDSISPNVSTFSIDVDTASYTQTREVILAGYKPEAESVRVEEFINYFKYNYQKPIDETPFAVHIESAPALWDDQLQIVKIGLQGKDIAIEDRLPSNLVFLIDTSGSMHQDLPLIQEGLRILTEQLKEGDRISIVTYSTTTQVVLDSATQNDKIKIQNIIGDLTVDGGTNGGQGLQMAYELALKNKIEGSINRVILCTDGDFNIGISSEDELKEFVSEKAQTGVELSVFGAGMTTRGDSLMEALSNHGGGNYFYLDSMTSVKRVFTEELSGILQTIAKDVKIQVHFSKEKVKSFHLLGYENRTLKQEDFENDEIDAGELGSGHRVTAFYEVALSEGNVMDESTMKVQLRYKDVNESQSQLLETKYTHKKPTKDFDFALSVAMFGVKIRGQKASSISLDQIYDLASSALLENIDFDNEKSKFLEFIRSYQKLAD